MERHVVRVTALGGRLRRSASIRGLLWRRDRYRMLVTRARLEDGAAVDGLRARITQTVHVVGTARSEALSSWGREIVEIVEIVLILRALLREFACGAP
jgi:hypothetical protein